MDELRTRTSALTQRSSAAEKIALFGSLFRGRTDVYPLRFQSKRTGISGYQPACGNEWVRGICEKPRVKCADCRQRDFLPLTDEVLRRHLSGTAVTGEDFVIGVYPMLRDETCYFVAVDFDREAWSDDALAFLKTCRVLDMPLARLFVDVARRFGSGEEEVDRARSASEAFLYRRLQTLDETMDRFQLNEKLAIPFDQKSRMEVDFLWWELRLVVELDGAQHLGDAAAYRRDRRKDALLQEQGFFVLRFLAEDLGTGLDHVLDTILRAVGRLKREGCVDGEHSYKPDASVAPPM